jgi:thiamine biosynthesis protein ThiI
MKFVALMSSGIDSPVATFLLSKIAKEIIVLHSNNMPFTDDIEDKKFIKIVKYLKANIPCKIKLYIIPNGNSLSSFKKNCENRFTCVFCKRMLVRYADNIANKEKADAIIMGDSLGQVASQTLKNLRVVEQATSLPILRPLIGLDKEDIVRIAKEIGTYELSISPSISCSAVPKKPSTQAKLEQILSEENKLNIEILVAQAVDNANIIEL